MKTFYRAMLWVIGIVTPVIIAACYGVQEGFSKFGRVVDGDTGEGIDGIRVTCVAENEVSYSNSYGEFWVYYWSDCDQLRIEDIDGVDNGGEYDPRTIPFDPDCEELTIELHR